MKLFKLVFSALLVSILLLGCNDAQEIAPLTSEAGLSLSSGQYSAEYSVEQAIEIFKSGDKEAIERVIKSKKRVIWDGESEFENGVNYRIGQDQIEKAREMSELFRKANDLDRAFQRGEKIKKKSLSPGLSASGISVDAWTLCGQGVRIARAIATVEPQMCRSGAYCYVRAGGSIDQGRDRGTGRFLYAAAMVVNFGGGQAFALAQGFGCGGGEMAAHGCY